MSAAMILAAGRGERMRPLTDHTPKCLLEAGGKPLIEWHIAGLRHAGYEDIVINHAWLGEQIEQRIGDGRRLGVRIRYSAEGTALETAGGIAKALTLLREDVFTVVNGDIFTDFPFASLPRTVAALQAPSLNTRAHLILVDNPDHHRNGDFALNGQQVTLQNGPLLTFSGIGVYHRALFDGIAAGTRAALGPLLKQVIARGEVTGARHAGLWLDVGTPERLAQADGIARASARAD